MSKNVLIIGAGPVGLTLASELTRYGVAVRIIDKELHRNDKSKALVIWSRTLELLDRGMGGDRFVRAGSKIERVVFAAGDKEIGHVAMDGVSSAFAFALTIPQSETERLLEEHLNGQGVPVERGTEAISFSLERDNIRAELRHPNGRVETVSAPWLVGCDGAHSAVRHALGAPFAGETLLSDWVLADVHMVGYPRPDNQASVYWHRDGVLIIFPISPGRYRILADLPYTETKVPPAPTIEQVQSLIDRRGPAATSAFDPIWLSGFRINGRKVADYRYGRVFLAGDAAHIHSPAGGQGMNTGMQDAFNLAWKLALVSRGNAPESLLDSYTPERSAVGDDVLKAADRLTAVATLKNPVVQNLRNLVGRVVLGFPQATHRVAATMSETNIHYCDSPLNGPGVHDGPTPGERMPSIAGQAPFGSGDTPKFTLLAEEEEQAEQLIERFALLINRELQTPPRHGVICLVRPDGYVAMSAPNSDVGWNALAEYMDSFSAFTETV